MGSVQGQGAGGLTRAGAPRVLGSAGPGPLATGPGGSLVGQLPLRGAGLPGDPTHTLLPEAAVREGDWAATVTLLQVGEKQHRELSGNTGPRAPRRPEAQAWSMARQVHVGMHDGGDCRGLEGSGSVPWSPGPCWAEGQPRPA